MNWRKTLPWLVVVLVNILLALYLVRSNRVSQTPDELHTRTQPENQAPVEPERQAPVAPATPEQPVQSDPDAFTSAQEQDFSVRNESSKPVTLEWDNVIFGTVLDSADAPVSEALVRCMTRDRMPPFSSISFANVVTDTSGYFILSVSHEASYKLVTLAEGFALQETNNVRAYPRRKEAVVIRLEPGGSISGAVLQAFGRSAIPNTQVIARPQTGRGRGFWGNQPEGIEAITDEAGQYVIPYLSLNQQYNLMAKSQEYAPASIQDVTPNSQGIDFYLNPGGAISGTVTLASTGDPVQNARVRAVNRSREALLNMADSIQTGRSDETGRYRVEGLGPGRYTLFADKEELVSTAGFDFSEIELEMAEEKTGVNLTLEPGTSISGRVVDPEERPVDAAMVAISPPFGGFSEAPLATTLSDAEGRFEFRRLMSGVTRYTLSAAKENLRSSNVEITLTPGAQYQEVKLVLTSGFAIQGTALVEETGVPVAEVRLALAPVQTRDDAKTDYTDGEGHFDFAGVASGQYSLRITPPEGFLTSEPMLSLTIADEDLKDVTVPLRLGRTQLGLVLDPDGKPVPNAPVYLAADRSARGMEYSDLVLRSTTDANGRFEIRNLPQEGTFRLIGSSPSFAPTVSQPIELIVGVTPDLRLTLEHGGTIAGLVTDASKTPVREGNITFEFQQQEGDNLSLPSNALQVLNRATARVDSSGKYRSQVLRVGSWSVQPRGVGGDVRSKTAEVREGAETTVDFTVPRAVSLAGTFTGSVVYSTGDPVPNARVNARIVGETQGRQGQNGYARSDQQGQFRMTGLIEDREYTLSAGTFRDMGFGASQNYTCPTDGIVLILPTMGIIGGSVVWKESGRPVQEFSVGLERPRTDEDSTFYRTTTRAKVDAFGTGQFIITDVNPGTYRVIIWGPNIPTTRTNPFELASGESKTNLVIEIGKGGMVKGTVVDANTGNPVSNAQISFLSEVTRPDDIQQWTSSAVSDRNGAFVLNYLTPGDVVLGARHGTYAPAYPVRVNDLDDGETKEVTIEMHKGGTITGAVVGISGDVLSGMTVTARAETPEGSEGLRLRLTTASDDRGSFSFTNLPAGSYAIRCREDYQVVEVPEGEQIALELRPGTDEPERATGFMREMMNFPGAEEFIQRRREEFGGQGGGGRGMFGGERGGGGPGGGGQGGFGGGQGRRR